MSKDWDNKNSYDRSGGRTYAPRDEYDHELGTKSGPSVFPADRDYDRAKMEALEKEAIYRAGQNTAERPHDPPLGLIVERLLKSGAHIAAIGDSLNDHADRVLGEESRKAAGDDPALPTPLLDRIFVVLDMLDREIQCVGHAAQRNTSLG